MNHSPYNPWPQHWLDLGIEVLSDTREQYPLPFPSCVRLENTSSPGSFRTFPVRTTRSALKSGDYTLSGHESTVCIERKGSVSELIKNLSHPADSQRQVAALARLASSCACPALLLECPVSDLTSSALYRKPDDSCLILSRLTRLIAVYNLHLFFAGRTTTAAGRRNVSTLLLYWMLNKCLTVVPDREVCRDV